MGGTPADSFGETRTYGQIATYLGSRTAARAVGAANRRNPISIVVPCHRVIGSSGKLTGFAGGLEAKAHLLEHEEKTRQVLENGLEDAVRESYLEGLKPPKSASICRIVSL
jgi:O-6-methylguanine DNA methyltransferase